MSTRMEKFAAAYDGRGVKFHAEVFRQGSAVIEAYEGVQGIDAFPFDGSMSKDEMIDHLVNVHGLREVRGKAISIQSGTKATKDEMVAYHDRIHQRQEDPEAEYHQNGSWYDRKTDTYEYRFVLGGFPVPKVKHVHSVAVVDPELQATAAAIRDNTPIGSKPLSSQEATVLRELIDNDFNGLRQQMRSAASDYLESAKAEINTDWDKREAASKGVAAKATSLQRKFNSAREEAKRKYKEAERLATEKHEAEFEAIQQEAEASGVTLSEGTETYIDRNTNLEGKRVVFTAVAKGREEALAEADKQNKAYLARAEMGLEQQRLAAQRRVLVSRVNEAGARILDSIPDAQTMLMNAQMGQQPKEIGK